MEKTITFGANQEIIRLYVGDTIHLNIIPENNYSFVCDSNTIISPMMHDDKIGIMGVSEGQNVLCIFEDENTDNFMNLEFDIINRPDVKIKSNSNKLPNNSYLILKTNISGGFEPYYFQWEYDENIFELISQNENKIKLKPLVKEIETSVSVTVSDSAYFINELSTDIHIYNKFSANLDEEIIFGTETIKKINFEITGGIPPYYLDCQCYDNDGNNYSVSYPLSTINKTETIIPNLFDSGNYFINLLIKDSHINVIELRRKIFVCDPLSIDISNTVIYKLENNPIRILFEGGLPPYNFVISSLNNTKIAINEIGYNHVDILTNDDSNILINIIDSNQNFSNKRFAIKHLDELDFSIKNLIHIRSNLYYPDLEIFGGQKPYNIQWHFPSEAIFCNDDLICPIIRLSNIRQDFMDYSVTVIDQNNKIINKTFRMELINDLSIDFDNKNIIMNIGFNEIIQFKVSGGKYPYEYQLDISDKELCGAIFYGESSIMITGKSSGDATIIFKITDSLGNTINYPLNISVVGTMKVNNIPIPDKICISNTYELIPDIIGGVGPYSFQWSYDNEMVNIDNNILKTNSTGSTFVALTVTDRDNLSCEFIKKIDIIPKQNLKITFNKNNFVGIIGKDLSIIPKIEMETFVTETENILSSVDSTMIHMKWFVKELFVDDTRDFTEYTIDSIHKINITPKNIGTINIRLDVTYQKFTDSATLVIPVMNAPIPILTIFGEEINMNSINKLKSSSVQLGLNIYSKIINNRTYQFQISSNNKLIKEGSVHHNTEKISISSFYHKFLKNINNVQIKLIDENEVIVDKTIHFKRIY